jgi:hypothetical protein
VQVHGGFFFFSFSNFFNGLKRRLMFSLYKTCTTKYDEILGQRKKKELYDWKKPNKTISSPSRSFFKNNNNNNKRNGNLRRVVPECRLTAR